MIGLKYAEHSYRRTNCLEWALKQNERMRLILLNADKHYRMKRVESRNARDF